MAGHLATVEIDAPGNATRWEAPLNYAGAPMFLQFVSDLTATDGRGRSLDVAVAQNQVVVNGGAPTEKSYTLRYVYRVPQSKSGDVHLSLPTLDAAHGQFDANLTFLSAADLADARAELEVSVPPNMPLRHSWGGAPRVLVDRARHLVSGLIVFGDFRYSTERFGPTEVTFALRGGYDEGQFRSQFGAIFNAQQEIAGPLPSSRLLVVAQDTTAAECKGTALVDAILVNMRVDTSLTPFNFQAMGTVSHELFHEWNLRYVTPQSEDGAYLLSEGFTNYFAVAALVRAGLIQPERFARFLWRYRQLLEQNSKC